MEPLKLERMRAYVAGIQARDGRAYNKAKTFADTAGLDPAALDLEAGQVNEIAELEAVMRVARPVLGIDKDAPDFTSAIESADPAAQETLATVKAKAPSFASVIPSIGRIELINNDRYSYAGTGWIIACDLGDDIIVTNAHVASIFAESSRTGFIFRPGTVELSRRQGAKIDFREELRGSDPREFAITEIIYVSERSPLLDVALLRVQRQQGVDRISGPIKLATGDPAGKLDVAAIGYPGIDSGAHDAALLMRLFGKVYEKKRLCPGKVVGMEPRGVSHDCSTLPGSSGSALIDLATGQAVGLHFRGKVFESNHAVPASAIARLIKDRPWQVSGRERSRPPLPKPPMPSSTPPGSSSNVTATVDANGVRLLVPLEISVRFAGTGQSIDTAAGPAPVAAPDAGAAEAAASRVNQQLLNDRDVVDVRSTYLFKDGLITDEIGIVVGVRAEASHDPATYGLESTFEGVPVVIETADLESLVRESLGLGIEAPAEFQNYERDLSDPRFNLDPVTDDMSIVLSVSPEAGWRELSAFLGRNDYDQLTVGIYHFTAPHVIEAMKDAIRPAKRRLTMTIDRKKGDDIGGEGTKADDRPEVDVLEDLQATAGNRFKFTAASISGAGKLFHSAYHIKVAVISERSGSGAGATLIDKAFWLSSGNWQSSNQAPITAPIPSLKFAHVKDFNREWHAIVTNRKLARVFRNHLEQDFEDNAELMGEEAALPALPDLLIPEALLAEDLEAPRAFEAFAPKTISGTMTVTPVLTPDNYADVVVPLIKGARDSVLFENQSFSLSDKDNMPEHYFELAKALLDRQKKGKDVRIIFRSGFGKERDTLRAAVKFGFDKKRIRFYGKCHTKGIVVDGERVLLGSQNWTGAGTGPNRDASLLIDHPDAGKYFAKVFEYSWRELARERVRDDTESMPPIIPVAADQEAPVPQGYRRVSWREWMEA